MSLILSAMFKTIFNVVFIKLVEENSTQKKVVLSKYTSTIFNVNLGSHINFSTEGHWKVNAGSHCRLALLFTDRQMDRPLATNGKQFYRFGWNIVTAYVKRRKLSRILERILRDKYSACKYKILNTYLLNGWVVWYQKIKTLNMKYLNFILLNVKVFSQLPSTCTMVYVRDDSSRWTRIATIYWESATSYTFCWL